MALPLAIGAERTVKNGQLKLAIIALAPLSATALLTRIGTYACGSLGIIVAIKGASARTVARMDSKQHTALPQNMQRYLLDFKRDFVDRHFGASFKVCDKFWLITTSSKSETPRFRTERGRRFGFWSNDSRKELPPLHSSWCAEPASHGAAKSRSHSANWLGSMLNSKLQTNVFSFMHCVDCVQLCRSSFFTE